MLHRLRTLVSIASSSSERLMNRKLQSLVDAKIRLLIAQAPITQVLEQDVFIVSYPKSGNTWFQNISAAIMYGLNLEYVPDTLIQELVPDVHYKKYYKRFRTPMFFKSHHLPKPEYKRVIYLLRDGRDVMVSYFHFLSALRDREIDFMKLVQGEGLFPCKWHEHVEAWLSNPYNAQMIVIKYEDLKTNPFSELQRFCAFVGIEREASFLESVIIQSSFGKARQRELAYGWDNPEWPEDKYFVRRGQVGSYKDEMPVDVLNMFLQDAAATLRKCGYV